MRSYKVGCAEHLQMSCCGRPPEIVFSLSLNLLVEAVIQKVWLTCQNYMGQLASIVIILLPYVLDILVGLTLIVVWSKIDVYML